MPTIFHADAITFEHLVYRAREDLVIVYFWGEPCANCADFSRDEPRLLGMLGQLSIRVVKVNAYDELDLVARFDLHGVPTFLLIKDGQTCGRMSFYPGFERWLEVVVTRLNAPD